MGVFTFSLYRAVLVKPFNSDTISIIAMDVAKLDVPQQTAILGKRYGLRGYKVVTVGSTNNQRLFVSSTNWFGKKSHTSKSGSTRGICTKYSSLTRNCRLNASVHKPGLSWYQPSMSVSSVTRF